jgi:hypothetical protein
MEAHGLTLEKRLEEVTKMLTMLMELLAARGINVSGAGREITERLASPGDPWIR